LLPLPSFALPELLFAMLAHAPFGHRFVLQGNIAVKTSQIRLLDCIRDIATAPPQHAIAAHKAFELTAP
jgi:hypothetical protein